MKKIKFRIGLHTYDFGEADISGLKADSGCCGAAGVMESSAFCRVKKHDSFKLGRQALVLHRQNLFHQRKNRFGDFVNACVNTSALLYLRELLHLRSVSRFKSPDIEFKSPDIEFKSSDIEFKSSDCDLKSHYKLLKSSYRDLKSHYKLLKSSDCDLKSHYIYLKRSDCDLKSHYKLLKSSYCDLKSHYSHLKSSYNHLKGSYRQFSSSYSEFDSFFSDFNSTYNQCFRLYGKLKTFLVLKMRFYFCLFRRQDGFFTIINNILGYNGGNSASGQFIFKCKVRFYSPEIDLSGICNLFSRVNDPVIFSCFNPLEHSPPLTTVLWH